MINDISQEARELATQAENMLTEYQGYAIETVDQYSASAETLKAIKAKRSALDEERKKMTRPLDDTKRRIMDFFKAPLDYLDKAEAVIKKAILGFEQDQEKKRVEEEKRLKDLADKEAERQRKLLEKKAEKAEEKGDAGKADELRQQATEVIAPVARVESFVPKVAGMSTSTVWKYRITDEKLIPREYLVVNETMIGQVARATKGTLAIPGVEIYAEEIKSVRR